MLALRLQLRLVSVDMLKARVCLTFVQMIVPCISGIGWIELIEAERAPIVRAWVDSWTRTVSDRITQHTNKQMYKKRAYNGAKFQNQWFIFRETANVQCVTTVNLPCG